MTSQWVICWIRINLGCAETMNATSSYQTLCSTGLSTIFKNVIKNVSVNITCAHSFPLFLNCQEFGFVHETFVSPLKKTIHKCWIFWRRSYVVYGASWEKLYSLIYCFMEEASTLRIESARKKRISAPHSTSQGGCGFGWAIEPKIQ